MGVDLHRKYVLSETSLADWASKMRTVQVFAVFNDDIFV